MSEAETLASALDAFASHRSAIISAKIEELGRAAAAKAAPPNPRTKREFQVAWLGAVAEPEARTWCLDTLTTKLPKLDSDGSEQSYGETAYALERRLAAMLDLAPDPRVAAAMIARLELREPVFGVEEVETLVWKLLERHADDRTGDALRAAGYEPDRLRLPAKVALPANAAARFRAAPKAARHDVDALWADVFAAPDEDEPRHVLADALMELGDPRGELIAIQLREAKGEATEAASARAAALVKEHGKDWLGNVRPIVYRGEFVRGMLGRIELAGAWSSSKWDQLAQDPVWQLVEEVEIGYANAEVFAKLLRTPALRANLRSVTIDSKPVWEAVLAEPLPRLRRLCCWQWKRGDLDKRLQEDIFPFVARTPSIVALGVLEESIAALDASIKERLVELETDGTAAELAKLWKKWPRLRKLASLWGDRIELLRDEKGQELARYRPTTFFKGDGRELLALPKSIERLEITGNAAFFKRAKPVLGKRFELVPKALPSGLVSNTKA